MSRYLIQGYQDPLTQFRSHAGCPSFPVMTCQTFCSALGGCFASVRLSPGRDDLVFVLCASHMQSTDEQSLHKVRPLNGRITRIQRCPRWQVPYSGNTLSVGLTYHIMYLEVGIILNLKCAKTPTLQWNLMSWVFRSIRQTENNFQLSLWQFGNGQSEVSSVLNLYNNKKKLSVWFM